MHRHFKIAFQKRGLPFSSDEFCFSVVVFFILLLIFWALRGWENFPQAPLWSKNESYILSDYVIYIILYNLGVYSEWQQRWCGNVWKENQGGMAFCPTEHLNVRQCVYRNYSVSHTQFAEYKQIKTETWYYNVIFITVFHIKCKKKMCSWPKIYGLNCLQWVNSCSSHHKPELNCGPRHDLSVLNISNSCVF